jgi:hypothetical protein
VEGVGKASRQPSIALQTQVGEGFLKGFSGILTSGIA